VKGTIRIWIMCVLLGAASVASAQVQCPTSDKADAKPWLNLEYSPECRARFVLNQLKSLDDKFLFLASEATSADGKQRKFVEELGLKQGGGSDGPAGVQHR
jgi:hypothetical protein